MDFFIEERIGGREEVVSPTLAHKPAKALLLNPNKFARPFGLAVYIPCAYPMNGVKRLDRSSWTISGHSLDVTLKVLRLRFHSMILY